jgi:hypothetical protein
VECDDQVADNKSRNSTKVQNGGVFDEIFEHFFVETRIDKNPYADSEVNDRKDLEDLSI